jgi:AAA+ superfamily predicted ATPase
MEMNIRSSSRATVAEKHTPWYLHNFMKSYLYLLSSGQCLDPDVQVVSLTGIAEPYSRRPKSISVSDDLGGRYVRVADAILTGSLRFRGGLYQVSVFFESRQREEVDYYVHILGEGENSGDAQVLLDHLLIRCVRTSPYQNEALLATSEKTNGQTIGLFAIDPGTDSLDDVFLPAETRRQLDLFISALSSFDRVRTPLRYLFSGKPGTGKTKIIRAIANACKGKATFLFSNGAERRVDDLFEIASMFSPVVLCIDDIDMLTGARQDGLYNRQLATFLQRLDGFAKGDQFLLATTNDKALVDLAASRPGRFDRILDVSLVEPTHYLSLVRSKSTNEAVVEQFDEEILGLLKRKRVSGAFIATLVKHLELISTFDPMRLDREYVVSTIEGSLEGFYEESRDGRREVGFRAA